VSSFSNYFGTQGPEEDLGSNPLPEMTIDEDYNPNLTNQYDSNLNQLGNAEHCTVFTIILYFNNCIQVKTYSLNFHL